MSPPLELDGPTHQEIERLCAAGDEEAGQGKYDSAVAEYNRAWQLIPEPKTEWEAATWVLAAIADAQFAAGKHEPARDALQQVMVCPGALGNPFLHLRFGEVSFELGELDKAADELMRAYMGAGPEIFANEDPKYLAFLKTRAKI